MPSKRKHAATTTQTTNPKHPTKKLRAANSAAIPRPAKRSTATATVESAAGSTTSSAPKSASSSARASFTTIPAELRVRIYRFAFDPAKDHICALNGVTFSCKMLYGECAGEKGEFTKLAHRYYQRVARRLSKKLTFPVRIARPLSLEDVVAPTILIPRKTMGIWRKSWPHALHAHLTEASKMIKAWPVDFVKIDWCGDFEGAEKKTPEGDPVVLTREQREDLLLKGERRNVAIGIYLLHAVLLRKEQVRKKGPVVGNQEHQSLLRKCMRWDEERFIQGPEQDRRR